MDHEALKRLAAKYIWWKTPEEALAMPARVVAQVMNIGVYDDVQALAHQVGDHYLRDVLDHAEIGQFNERWWAYWHYRLGLAAPPHPRLGRPRQAADRQGAAWALENVTFIAGLRHDGIVAPCVIDGPINGARFAAWSSSS